MANEVNITVTGTDKFSQTIDTADKKVSGFGKTLGSVGTIAGGFLAAGAVTAGVQALTGFIGDSIGAVRESKEVNAQLEAVLKSTGGASGLTADSVRDMASALEKSTKFEDEAILKGQNLLLTFTNIGSDVFPMATETMLDMAQALGTDASGAAVQLGKALNDPVAGISALSRVGVTFTDEQKDMIKGMVEAGDVAGAQGVILAELNKEFGGSAKAASDAAGSQEKYKDAMNDLQEQIGGKMLPIQEKLNEAKLKLVTLIADKVIPILEELYAKHWPAISKGIQDAVAKIEEVWPKLEPIFAFIFDFFKTKVEGFFQQIEGIIQIVTGLVEFFDAIVHGDWQRAWDALGTIADGVLNLVIGYVKTTFGNIPGIIAGFAKDAFNGAKEFGQGIADGIGEAIKDGINIVIDQINGFLRYVSGIQIDIPSVDVPLVGTLGGGSVGMPDLGSIPRLAKGGIAVGPQLAIVGDNPSRREAIIPLDGAGGIGGLGTVINIYNAGSILSERDIVRIIRDEALNGGFRGVLASA